VTFRIAAVLLFAASAFAQDWQAGASIGYGWYRQARINGPGAEAQVGIQNRFTAGAVLTEDLYEHISGEVRYLYQDGDPYLSLSGRKAIIQGQSHSFVYDTLFHIKNRDQRLRPFVALGVGAKLYRTTGPEPSVQPAPGVGALVREDEWRLLVSVGAGVTYRFRNHLIVRADFRDYITPFPGKIFAPAENSTARGLMHMFTPMVGVGYWF
jgi:hypothetical protein